MRLAWNLESELEVRSNLRFMVRQNVELDLERPCYNCMVLS